MSMACNTSHMWRSEDNLLEWFSHSTLWNLRRVFKPGPQAFNKHLHPLSHLAFVCFKTVSHCVAQGGLKFYTLLPIAGIVGMCHYIQPGGGF